MAKTAAAGTTMPRFFYDTPSQSQQDFYALCEGSTPLVLVFLPNFGHPISREYLARYLDTLQALTAGRLACVVQSDPANLARRLGGQPFAFPLICDAEGVLYRHLAVQTTASLFSYSLETLHLLRQAKKEGYRAAPGAGQLLPLTMVLGPAGQIQYAHYGRTPTDLPEDCAAIQRLCEAVRQSQPVPQSDAFDSAFGHT